ncbi:type II toxin-antitoxin system RelE/ParE family toxin [Luteolibacter flavescens]|uniref:Type II toxin-antitoxin system RelE/ParE family toxin n=1 Tax=Luteolibacter flavescens TaxID=1859460 RepID=A0ABT3FV48_9BACT|nr:type II toxin-antitoxin system RelE/ParE family toxin [Luteolibacter flavescens]MCW1887089.1 type II toxin-antitoxin system RelE/ParE family toxin [Luteolibacter flavescens]
MRAEFSAEARADLFDAVAYYEGKEAGLGKRLRDEVARMLLTVVSAPYLWRERRGGYRRVNCPVFPYYLAYVVREEVLVVVAVAHSSRRPGYWQDRL